MRRNCFLIKSIQLTAEKDFVSSPRSPPCSSQRMQGFYSCHIQKHLLNYYFYDKSDNDIFIDQHIILIKKNNLHLEDKGIITSMNKNKIGLCINDLYNKYYDMNNYYIFIKNRTKKTSERDVMESLLKNL